jgi:hypothetical protein
MQLRGTALLKTAVVGYLLCVIVFALLDPFHNSGVWVYGMSALVTVAGAMEARKPRPVKPAPSSPIEHARHVWELEREVGIEPWPIFGETPPSSGVSSPWRP